MTTPRFPVPTAQPQPVRHPGDVSQHIVDNLSRPGAGTAADALIFPAIKFGGKAIRFLSNRRGAKGTSASSPAGVGGPSLGKAAAIGAVTGAGTKVGADVALGLLPNVSAIPKAAEAVAELASSVTDLSGKIEDLVPNEITIPEVVGEVPDGGTSGSTGDGLIASPNIYGDVSETFSNDPLLRGSRRHHARRTNGGKSGASKRSGNGPTQVQPRVERFKEAADAYGQERSAFDADDLRQSDPKGSDSLGREAVEQFSRSRRNQLP